MAGRGSWCNLIRKTEPDSPESLPAKSVLPSELQQTSGSRAVPAIHPTTSTLEEEAPSNFKGNSYKQFAWNSSIRSIVGCAGDVFNCHEYNEPVIARDCPNRSQLGRTAKDCTSFPSDNQPAYLSYIPKDVDVDMVYKLSVKSGVNITNFDGLEIEVAGVGERPQPIDSFDELDMPDPILGCVQKHQWIKPFPIQRYAIPIILSGRDLMACAQTGSGKTAAYILPIAKMLMECASAETTFDSEISYPMALVLVPTRELCCQVHEQCLALINNSSLTAQKIHGNISHRHLVRCLQKGAHILVGTVGRLKDFVNRGLLSLSNVKYLVLDEADRMLDQGFLSDVTELIEQTGKNRQLCMFSATFTDEIQSLAQNYLVNYLFLTVGRVGSANPDVNQQVLEVRGSDKLNTLMQLLEDFRGEDGFGDRKVLVFVETKINTNIVALSIHQRGIPCTNIHGARMPEERADAFNDFRTGNTPVMVTTNVTARGVDISGIELVINYDLPTDIVQYVHRIGRSGRFGNPGRSISFFDPQTDIPMARQLLSVMQSSNQPLAWLEDYAEQYAFDEKSAAARVRDIRRDVTHDVERIAGDSAASFRPQISGFQTIDEDWS